MTKDSDHTDLKPIKLPDGRTASGRGVETDRLIQPMAALGGIGEREPELSDPEISDQTDPETDPFDPDPFNPEWENPEPDRTEEDPTQDSDDSFDPDKEDLEPVVTDGSDGDPWGDETDPLTGQDPSPSDPHTKQDGTNDGGQGSGGKTTVKPEFSSLAAKSGDLADFILDILRQQGMGKPANGRLEPAKAAYERTWATGSVANFF